MSSLMRQLWGRGGSEEVRRTPAEDFRPEGATPPPSKGGRGELEGLRLLVFRDAWEWGERRLLFDSSQSPRPSTSPTPQSPTTPPFRLEMAEKVRETKMLGEMIFGSVSIAFKGNTIKLHNYRDGGLVVSKVFSSRRKSSLNTSGFPPSICEKGGMEYSSDSDSQYSTVNSLSGLVVGAASTPLDVPERLFRSPTSSLGSGAGTGTIAGSIPSRSASAAAISETMSLSGSPISRSLRLRTAQTFSLDQGVSGRRSRKAASEGSSATSAERRKSAQLGLAVILGRGEGDAEAWRRFLFAHMALLETELWALQGGVEAAVGERAHFVGKVWLSWDRFRGRLGQLFWGHRLEEPVWSSLRSYEEMGAREKAASLRRRFAATFVRLARLADTKERNFFLSNLVTGVLGEHGTWVGSVAPASAARPFLRQMAAQTRLRRGGLGEPPPSPPPHPILTPEITITGQGSLKEREEDSSSHLPYNPLGAQYSELRGRIGDSSSGGQASVLLTGSDAELVREFLFLLSYFIRCSQVRSAEASAQALPASDELASERLFVPGPILPPVIPALPTPSPPRPDFIPLQRPSAEWVGGGGGPSSPEKRPRPPSPLVAETRPRSDSLLGLRGSLAAAGLTDSEEIPAPSVIQINQRRFEVRTVPDSAISAPTGGFIGGMGGAARAHHLRPGPLSPKKRYQHQRRPQAQPEPIIHPSSSQPEVWTEPLPPLVCEPLDLEKYPKLRKVSASALGKMAPGLNLDEEKVSPGQQQHLSSDADSGGCSSGGEDATRTIIAEQSRQPRSLDSGIAEADAIHLMEASGRKAPSPPNPTSTSANLHPHLHPHLVSTHSSVMGPSLETEEFVGEKESVTGAEAEAATEELGRSLFGGFLSTYSPHFVLAGCPPRADLIPTILEDLGATASAQQSEEGADEEDEEESHSVCVLGSTDQWTVRILSSKLGVRPALVPSQIVLRGVEAALSLADLGASPEFILHSLEETLGEIWRKSLGLAGAVEAAGKGDGSGQWLEMEELVSLAGVDWADLPLLFSVAGLHSHRLLASLSAQS